MSNRNLIILLAILLGIFLITQVSDRRGERNFKDILVQLDSTNIDRIKLYNVEDDQAVIELTRIDNGWSAQKGDLEVTAQQNTVNSLLNTLQLIKSKRLISRSEEKWADYEVDPENGTRIEVFSGKKKLDDFIVGRFNFNQQTRTAISYIRKMDESDIYSVDGFLSMSFNQSFDSFRDKTLIKVNPQDINQLKLQKQGTELSLSKQGTNWLNGDGMSIDSVRMAQYTNALASSFGSEFEDDFSPANNPLQRIEIFGDNMLDPIGISCYETTDTLKPFILHSTQNDDAYFRSDSTGVYKKIFGDFPME